jgi:hypothetical protein
MGEGALTTGMVAAGCMTLVGKEGLSGAPALFCGADELPGGVHTPPGGVHPPALAGVE